jgi:hypothetical protein
MQYTAGISNNSASYDTWVLGSFDNTWSNELYANVINNLGILIQKHKAEAGLIPVLLNWSRLTLLQ